MKTWNTNNGKLLKTLEGRTSIVYALKLLPSGLIASESNDGTIRISGF